MDPRKQAQHEWATCEADPDGVPILTLTLPPFHAQATTSGAQWLQHAQVGMGMYKFMLNLVLYDVMNK